MSEKQLFEPKLLKKLHEELRPVVTRLVDVYHDMYARIPNIEECIRVTQTAFESFNSDQHLTVHDAIEEALSRHLGLPLTGGGSYSPGALHGSHNKRSAQKKAKYNGSGSQH